MEILHLDELLITGIKVEAHWKELFQKIPEAWNSLFQVSDQILNRNSDFYTEISVSENKGIYTQLVGAEISSELNVPKEFVTLYIPRQKYVYYHHKGDLQEITNSFGRMYDWANKHNLKPDQFKIDRGYLPGLPNSPHHLFIKLSGH